MGPLPISCRVGEDHRQIKSSGDVRGPEYPWPHVDGEMKSCRVGLAPGCHRVVELNDHPRVEKLTGVMNSSREYCCTRSIEPRSFGSWEKSGRS